MRFLVATILNVFAPGSGLMLLGHAWTGLIAAVLFAICAEVALVGVLLSPGGVPGWLTISTGALAAGTWVLGQWMLRDRIGVLRSPSLGHELQALRQEASEAIARGDLLEARDLLRIAADLDLDSAETMVLWAQLMMLLGRFRESRRAWKRILRTGDERFVREAITAIERLPAR
jgi:hypothetical protein